MIKKKYRLYIYVLVGAFLLGGTYTVVTGVVNLSIGAAKVSDPIQAVRIVSHADRPTYSNLLDVTNASDAVFIGTVEGVDGTRNLARNPQDPSKEDPERYVEGVDYRVDVSELLKGNDTDKQVLVTETKLQRIGKEQVEVPDANYIGLVPGQSYIFFVKKSAVSGRYNATGQPFIFSVNNNKVELQTTEKDLMEQYQVEELITFKDKVKKMQ